jgi:hypothetical protein
MYDRQSLEIRHLPEGGTEVCIVLPARYSTQAVDLKKAAQAHTLDSTPVHHG